MKELIKGIHHFKSEIFASKKELFEKLSRGQEPQALFITCSDSRINPNLITQTEPGELFILRNAGNIIPAHGAANGGEGATIEFAVAGLGISEIIICGHTDCGAMKGILHPEKIKTMPTLCNWLNHAEATRRIISENYPYESDADKLNIAMQENVLVQLESLKTHPCIAAKLGRGQLSLHGWTYKIETGEVFAYSEESGQFELLIDAPKMVLKPQAKKLSAHSI